MKKLGLALIVAGLMVCMNSMANEPPTASGNGRYDGLFKN
jgi:hypothetical protein